MVKYRPQRGSLAESMAETIVIDGFKDLLRHLQDAYPGKLTAQNVAIKYLGYDDRISWDTYIVTVDSNGVGFTDGPVQK